jgi:4'-phosphopantetheinyl transferase
MTSIAFAESGPDLPQRFLSAAEFERAEVYKSPQRRNQFLLSRALLRALLERHTGRPAQSFTIRSDERGKPHCVDGPAIGISHSRNIVACAVTTDGAIGLDLEFPGRHRDTSAIARRYFSPMEADWLASQPADRFFMLWVLKEAWLKALGTGIAGGLDSLQCSVSPPRIDAMARTGELGDLGLFALQEGFMAVATTAAALADLEFLRWHPASGKFVAADDVLPIAAYPGGSQMFHVVS